MEVHENKLSFKVSIDKQGLRTPVIDNEFELAVFMTRWCYWKQSESSFNKPSLIKNRWNNGLHSQYFTTVIELV